MIYIENIGTIKYTGKSAVASFALMGVMGPMGAAIGVAIDEGISKDIRKNIEASGFGLVRNAMADSAELVLARRLSRDGFYSLGVISDGLKGESQYGSYTLEITPNRYGVEIGALVK